MPSKDEVLALSNNSSSTDETKDFFNVSSPEVEELVAAIKQNLRLKSRSCHSLCAKQKRMSPYDVPGRTCKQHTGDQCHSACAANKKQVTAIVEASNDPYEMLQELLKEGSLIKEAVKRLQLGVGPTKENTDFYEFDCSVCDLPTTNVRTVEL